MGFIAHRMHAARVDPSIVEIEQSTYSDGVIDRFVRIAGLMESFDIRRLDGYGIGIYFTNKAEESFFRLAELRGIGVLKYAVDEFPAAQQFRRDRGVRFRSKRAPIQI